MQSDPGQKNKDASRNRGYWRAAFWIGATPLVGCATVIGANPLFGAVPGWVYWLALGSGALCIFAALRLRSYDRYDAAEEGVWLAKMGTRRSRSAGDDLDGVDD